MDNNLNWEGANFDHNRFQRFCNMLLMYEISPNVVPFSAPGKDGGVDAWFDGEYAGFSGKWRFQAKYKSVERKEAINKLRADIKADIVNNLREEDHLIFLTNISIGPDARNNLIDGALTEINKVGKRDVRFDIWDEAKLEGLIGRHGVVYQYFFGKGERYLVPWEDYFSSKLDAPPCDISGFSGLFVGRENEIESLIKWLHDNDSELFHTIQAPGGWGKTRLTVEFFKELGNRKSRWSVWIPASRSALKAENLSIATSGADQLLILIDDADLYMELEDLVNAIGSRELEGRIKLLLTMRNARIEAFYDGKSPQFLLKQFLRLGKLNHRAAYDLCYNIVDGSIRYQTIDRIVEAADGVPLVIKAMVSVANRGHSELFKDKTLNFGKIVQKYLEEIANHAGSKTKLLESQVIQVLSLASVISPFSLKDNAQHLGEYLGFEESPLREVLSAFLESGILQVVGSNMEAYQNEDTIDLLLYDEEKIEKRLTKWIDASNGRSGESEFVYVPVDQYAVKPDPFADAIVAETFWDRNAVQKLMDSGIGLYRGDTIITNIWRSRAVSKRMKGIALYAFSIYEEHLRRIISLHNGLYWALLFKVLKATDWQLHKVNFEVACRVMVKLKGPEEIIRYPRLLVNDEIQKESFRHSFNRDIKSLFEKGLEVDSERKQFLDLAEVIYHEIGEKSWHLSYCRIGHTHIQGKESLGKLKDFVSWIKEGPIERVIRFGTALFQIPHGYNTLIKWYSESENLLISESIREEIDVMLLDLVHWINTSFRHEADPEIRENLLGILVGPLVADPDSEIPYGMSFDHHRGEVFEFADCIVDFLEELAREKEDFLIRYSLVKVFLRESWGSLNRHKIDRVRELFDSLIKGTNLSEEIFFIFLLEPRRYFKEGRAEHQIRTLLTEMSVGQVVDALLFLFRHQSLIHSLKVNFPWWIFLNSIASMESYDPDAILDGFWEKNESLDARIASYFLSDLRFGESADEPKFWKHIKYLKRIRTAISLDTILSAFPLSSEGKVLKSLDRKEIEMFHQIGEMVCRIEVPEFDDGNGVRIINYPPEYLLHRSYKSILRYSCQYHRGEFQDDLIAFLKVHDPRSSLQLLGWLAVDYLEHGYKGFRNIIFFETPYISLYEAGDLWKPFLDELHRREGANGMLEFFSERLRHESKEKSHSICLFRNRFCSEYYYPSKKIQKAGNRQIGDFYEAWNWWKSLNPIEEEIRIDDALHVLDYFFEEDFEGEELIPFLNGELRSCGNDLKRLWLFWYAGLVWIYFKPTDSQSADFLELIYSLRAKIQGILGNEALKPFQEVLAGWSARNPEAMNWAACYFLLLDGFPFKSKRLLSMMEGMKEDCNPLYIFRNIEIG